MHEFSMMDRILKVVLSEARKHSAEEILEIGLAVGELTFLNPEQLRFAFEALSEATLAEGAKLKIEVITTSINCSQCGYSGSISYGGPEDHLGYAAALVKCKVCGGRDLKITSGRECTIRNLKVKTSSVDVASEENA